MRRTILTLSIIVALLLTVPATGAGPSLSRLARDVSTALRTARKADANARAALAATGTQAASGASGANGSDGAKGAAGSDGARGLDGRVGEQGSKGDGGVRGDAGPAGAQGPPVSVGFAHVMFDRLDAEHSRNVTMSRGMNGSVAYCFKVEGGVKAASVSLDGSMFNASNVRGFVDVPAREACPGADASVVLADVGAGPLSGGFWVAFQ